MTDDKKTNRDSGIADSLLAAILDNVLDGIITIDAGGMVASFNKSAEEIFGYTAAEVIGSNVNMLMPEPFHSQHDDYLKNYIATRQKKIIGIGRQVEGKRKDGSRFSMDLTVAEMNLDGKRMFTGIVRDVTERVRADRMKSEFVSTVSHELRTPLTSIHGALGLIAGGVGGALPAQAKMLVDIACKNSERLILLVNDILDMEKLEVGKMQFQMRIIDLLPLLRQAIEANHAYAAQFKVSYELDNDLPDVRVSADSHRLMQALVNLLSNAAKFSPAGGKVEVGVAVVAGKRVRVSVTDHGFGIPEQFRGQVFQKFTQADSSDTRKKGGAGLGLFITKSIVERMGGSICFESEPNVRTVFFVEFPVCDASAAPVPETAGEGVMWRRPAEAQGARAHPKILHVEDDSDLFRVLNMIVSEFADMDNAASIASARRMLKDKHYDLAILDLSLPDGSGMDLLPALNAARPPIPAMVFSAAEMAWEDARKVNLALLKSRTDNQTLLANIKRLIGVE